LATPTSLFKEMRMRACVKLVDLPQATHFVRLDRPQRGCAQLIDDVAAFLADWSR
jgi:hypothetical protein